MTSDHSVPGWKPLVQPDGQPYFLNNSQHLRFRYLTETNLYEDRLLDEINFFVSEFEERARRRKFPPISSEVEVVLQPTENLWLYYMVDVERRCVFWMDKCVFDGSIIPPYFGIERKEHLREYISLYYIRTLIIKLQAICLISSSGNIWNSSRTTQLK